MIPCNLRFLAALCGIGVAGLLSAADRPNLVLILADDLGYGDLGCYGSEKIRTPRLDAMAREGLRFTQHYAGNTVCAPARCCLMTGLHPGHAYVRGNRQYEGGEGQLPIPDEALTIAEVLREAGYATGMFGKWGLGNPGTSGDPLKQGWDTYFGYTDQVRAHNYYPDFLLRDGVRVPLDNEVVYLDSSLWHKGIGSYSTRQSTYSHDLIEAEALAFVRRHRDRPFFLYLPVTLPHDNGEAREQTMEIPDFGLYADQPGWTDNQKGYAAMVTRLDVTVGRVLDLLRELGLEQNTLVLFTSDNGPAPDGEGHKGGWIGTFFDSNGPWRGHKGQVYEGGLRVPLLARWPGRVPAGAVSDHPGAHWDFFATACELAGQAVPAGIDGISLRPTLLGRPGEQRAHSYLYWQSGPAGDIAIREGDWKGVWRGAGKSAEPRWEVYHLGRDPAETEDRAEAEPAQVAEFQRLFKAAHRPSVHFPLAVNQP